MVQFPLIVFIPNRIFRQDDLMKYSELTVLACLLLSDTKDGKEGWQIRSLLFPLIFIRLWSIHQAMLVTGDSLTFGH